MLLAVLLITSAPEQKFVRSVIEAATRVLPNDTRIEGVDRVPHRLPRAPYKLTVTPLSTRLYGRVPVRVVASNLRDEVEIQLVLRVVFDRPVVRLAHNVSAGTVLTAQDLVRTTEEVRETTQEPLADVEMAIGKKLRNAGKAGQALFARDVEPLPVFSARAKLLLISRSAGVQVSAPAEAQESGTPGANVRVMNLLSKRMVVARVVDAQTVEIR